ncbi:MAG TPA: DNA primase [Candidatus Binatia bacterium]|nr:DNA primase [Candidatus Binatia bacterium]
MAGRIPEAFIQDLLGRTDIVQVIGERLSLKKAGKEYVALSPFTNEKTASFTVSPQKQFYHCFSSGKHGTAITFLMEYDRLSFVEAVEELAKRAGVSVPREGGAAPAPVLDGPLDALAAAERIYKAELRRSSAVIDYLKQRGVAGETAKAFGLGYAPSGWDTLARQFPDPKHAIDAGLLVRNDQGRIYDFYRHRVMFPVRDTRGRVITFGGRVLPGSDDNRKYLNGRETALFNKSRNLYGLYEARKAGDLASMLVVEGYMDCVMLHQHGLTNAVATLGTATTREHLQLLFKSTSRVVFCFDGDRAGRAAAWRALEQALPEMHEGRECRFMFLPEGEDPDTSVQKLGAAEFRLRAEQALPLSRFLLDELSRGVSLGTPDGRARLAALARPHLERLREGSLRSAILDELGGMTRLTRADLERPVAPKPGPARDLTDPAADAALSRPVRRALQLLLEQPALAAGVDLDALPVGDDPVGGPLLRDALQFFRQHPQASAGQWLENWRDRPEAALVNRLAALRVEVSGEALEREFGDAMKHLSRRGLEARLQQLVQAARSRALSPEEQRDLDLLKRQLVEMPSV